MSLQTLLILVGVIFVLVLAVGWWMASRVKRNIDQEEHAASVRTLKVQVTLACVTRLASLSREPLLVKRVEGDLKIQIGDKPMVKLASLPDRNVRAALREAAVAIDVQYGAAWTAVVRMVGPTELSVTRIA